MRSTEGKEARDDSEELAFLLALFTAVGLAAMPAAAQPKPNILFIMGDDIGWMQPSVYRVV
jgi:hypothetical protein